MLAKGEEFSKATKTLKVNPPVPPLTPTITEANPTQFQITQANRDHNKLVNSYFHYQIFSASLKKLITNNIDDVFLGNISIESQMTVLKIITHLKSKYYKISSTVLRKNDIKLRENWDVETPIEH